MGDNKLIVTAIALLVIGVIVMAIVLGSNNNTSGGVDAAFVQHGYCRFTSSPFSQEEYAVCKMDSGTAVAVKLDSASTPILVGEK